MARIYCSSKGQSISIKPFTTTLPEKMVAPVNDIKTEIISLAKANHTASSIGVRLRDVYGIGNSKDLLGCKLGEFIAQHIGAPKVPEDLQSIIDSAKILAKHINSYTADNAAKYRLGLQKSKAGRLIRYYKRTGKLPKNYKLLIK